MERTTSRPKLIILGTRLFAEEVADLVGDGIAYDLVGFAENWERERCRAPFLGLPVHWVDDLPPLAPTHFAVCAIGTTRRAAYIAQVEGMGFRFATVLHPTARVSRTARVGPGCIVSAGVVVAAHTTIGRHVIVNRGVLIGHHTVVGDCVTVSPGANIAGCVRIGARTYVGMGAIICDRISVGTNVVVGAGAIVAKDVPDNVRVVGTQARAVRVESREPLISAPDVEARLRQVLADVSGFRAAEVGLETSLYGKGIGLSSVDIITLIVRVEEVLDVFFDDDEIAGSVETFGALVRAVCRKRAARRGPGGSDDR